MAHLLEGAPAEEALEASFALVETRDQPGKRVREMMHPLEDYEHNPGGWTVYTTRLALLCLLEASNFRSALERAIQLGGDADTNGAVVGALLGARFGASGIPSRWLEDLEGGESLLASIRA